MVVLSDVSDQMLVSYYVPDSSVTQRDKSQRSELLRFKCSINDAFQAGRILNGYTLLVKDKLKPFQKFEYEMEISRGIIGLPIKQENSSDNPKLQP